MSSSDIPIRDTDQDWLDDAILAAILALQFGNTSALQLETLANQARLEIEGLLRAYKGGKPGKILSRIAGVVARLIKDMEKRSDEAILFLVAMEARNLGARQKDLRDLMMAAAINGWTVKGLIKRYIGDPLSQDLPARIKTLTRGGAKGDALVDGTRKILDGTTRAAGTVGRTRANAAVSEGRKRYAIKKGLKLRWISVLDSRTTIQCINLDGEEWDAREPHPLPPIHPNCRSSVVVVTGAAPKRNKNYSEWLQDQPKSVQDAVLGVARARAWREGSLSIRQMVDATRTRPISTQRLREMGRL